MNKRYILTVAAAAAVTVAAGQVNAPDGAGYLLRAGEMMDCGNFVGCLDQISRAIELPLALQQVEEAELMRAEATVHTNKETAILLLGQWLNKYPASDLRGRAQLALADCYSDFPYEVVSMYDEINPSTLIGTYQQDLFYRAACANLRIGCYDQAEELFKKVTDSRYAQAARIYLTYIDYINERFDKARAALAQGFSSDAPGSSANYYYAQLLFWDSQWAQAQQVAEEMLRSHPNLIPWGEAEMHRVAGESAYYLGKTAEARKHLNTYIQQVSDPKLENYCIDIPNPEERTIVWGTLDPSAAYILGLIAYADGDYAQCARMMQLATKDKDQMSQSAYVYIGQSLLAEADYDGAAMAFDQAMKLDFDPEVQEAAHFNYGVASLQGGLVPFGASVRTFEDFLRLHPDSPYAPQAQQYVISAYFAVKDYAGALASIKAMKHPTPDTYKAQQQALYLLGAQELAAGEADKAADHLRQAVELAKYDAEIARESRLLLGEAYYRQGKYADSERALSEYLNGLPANSPNRPIALYDMGYALLGQKKCAEAAKYFDQFIKKAPNADLKGDGYFRLGDCYYYTHQYAKAAEAYDKALDCVPALGDYALYQKALMEGYQRKHSDKVHLMQQMLDRFPTSTLAPDAMLEMTESYIQLGDNAAAISVYEQLVEKHPSTPQARQGLLQMAVTLYNDGQTDRAITAFEQVISRYPTSEEAQMASEQYKRIAADHGMLGRYASFVNSVDGATRIDDAEIESLAFEAAEVEYVANGKTDKLVAYVDEHSSNPAHSAKALWYLAESANAAGDKAQAYSRVSEIANRYPDSGVIQEALALKAQIEQADGRGALALRTWQALDAKASSAYMRTLARMGIGRCAVEAQEWQTAIDALSATSALSDADKREAAYLLGAAYDGLGDTTKAREQWEAYETNPADANSMRSAFSLAESYYKAGDYTKAEELARAVANAATLHIYWMARGFILLADIYAAQGNEYKAQQYLNSLKSNYPGTEEDIFLMIDQRIK